MSAKVQRGKYATITVPFILADAVASVSAKFIDGMVKRILTSHHKYGPANQVYPHQKRAIDNVHKRLLFYKETGNTEWLIDAANFCMLEYMFPSHPDSHYRPTDSDESPGLV